ncbi:MAG: hypothetical protein WD066_11740 [Planctomycetaceae bacterium]
MTTMRSPHRLVALAGIACALASSTGCAGLQLLDWTKGDRVATADARNPVQQIVCIWEPSEGHDMDGLPTRGFAGQILFFTAGSPKPVKVNGDVRIYEYDNLGSAEAQGSPLHQFDFLGEAWTAHFRPHPSLGPAYQVFVPYVRKGPWQAHCALRVRFTAEGARPMFSDLVHVTLPGPHSPTGAIERANPLAKFRNQPNPADVKLGATLDQKRLSAADREFEKEIVQAARERATGPQIHEFELTGGRAAQPLAPRGGDVEADRNAALGDAEIERLVREYHQSQARSARQVAPRTLSADIVEDTVRMPSADSTGSASSSAAPSGRRYRLSPAVAEIGTRSVDEDEFDALFSGSGRTARTSHPLSDLARNDHPLAEE